MQQIVNFLIRNKNFLLFALLLLISIIFTVQSHSYHRSRVVNSANWFAGGIYTKISGTKEYLNLKIYNRQLLEENAKLRSTIPSVFTQGSLVTKPSDLSNLQIQDSTIQYSYIPAQVVNNNYSKTDNFITLFAGERDQVKKDMGVVTSKGIVGIIDNTSSKYSTVLSLLNTNFTTNAKLRKSEHFGTAQWDGKDPNSIKIIDMQEQAPVAIGDTIETSGKSAIFPKGIPIGTIRDFELDQSKNFYTLYITLVNDMTNLGHVYIIENSHREEILKLETSEDE